MNKSKGHLTKERNCESKQIEINVIFGHQTKDSIGGYMGLKPKKEVVKYIKVKTSHRISTNAIRKQIKSLDKKAVVGSGAVSGWRGKAGNC